MMLSAMLMVASVMVMPTNAATQAVQNGMVDFGRGDAQIVITGNEGQSLVGKEFKLYQLFYAENATGSESINYTFHPDYKTALQTVVGTRLKTDSSKITEYEVVDYILSLSQNSVQESRTTQKAEGSYSEFRYFVEALRNEIQSKNIEGDTIQVSSVSEWNSVTVTGLEYGYYIVDEVTDTADTSQATSLCMVNTANPSAAISMKSDYPIVVKQIQEDDNQDVIGNHGWNDIGDYEIGQNIPYRYESAIPNMNGYSTYYWAWHDVMDEALTLLSDTIQITISGSVRGVAKTYTLSEEEFQLHTDLADTTFRVEIKNLKALIDREFPNQNDKQENSHGQTIAVKYQAYLNENAISDDGTPGFENDVRVEFSNNPNQGHEEQTGFTSWDTVVCFTYEAHGIKVNNYGTPLEGAVFRLYTDEACENEVCIKKIKSGYQVLHKNRVTQRDLDDNDGIRSDAKGEFRIYGLDSGIYYLKEVGAPAGYRLLLEPTQLQIKASETSTRNNYVKGEGIGAKNLEFSVVNEVRAKLPITGSGIMLILSCLGIVLMWAAVKRGKRRHE